ncbi:MAG: macro domain-containing protein [Armatimonadetes bacterium]|nr:macro domain-containing protein [Armatimonadota bacterium]MCX7968449.1 macro domain-containing protein [Armatimonadota bacterium]MDW8142776.1 macro domain-containing protein [Armatimonadota bacterium]
MNTVVREVKLSSGQTIRILRGDITAEQVDAIVNAANQYLKHNGGVAAAIVRKGGEVIQQESDEWVRQYGLVRTGQVAVTSAGNLPAKVVIHAVGPVWHEHTPERADELLKSAVWNSFMAAHKRGFFSIALPAISAGIFGFPKERCASILLDTAKEFCEKNPDTTLKDIRFVLFDEPTFHAFVEAFDARWGSRA